MNPTDESKTGYRARVNCQMTAPLTAIKDRRPTGERYKNSRPRTNWRSKRQWPTFTNGLKAQISQWKKSLLTIPRIRSCPSASTKTAMHTSTYPTHGMPPSTGPPVNIDPFLVYTTIGPSAPTTLDRTVVTVPGRIRRGQPVRFLFTSRKFSIFRKPPEDVDERSTEEMTFTAEELEILEPIDEEDVSDSPYLYRRRLCQYTTQSQWKSRM